MADKPTDAEIVEAMALALCAFEDGNWEAANFTETPSGETPDEMRAGYIAAAQAAYDAQRVMGLVLVPVGPTEEMVKAGCRHLADNQNAKGTMQELMALTYRAMIAAAQEKKID